MHLARHTWRGSKTSQRGVEELNAQVAKHQGRVQIVNPEGLHPLATRPSLREYISQLWERRFFIAADARAKALRTTRDYRLWQLWLVLNPLFDVALYGFLFGMLMKTSRGIENFIGFLFIGIIFMSMMTGLMNSGISLMQSSRSMIRAFQFPRASIPFSTTLRSMIDNVLPAIVALMAAFLFQWGTGPSWTLIFVVPLFLLIHVFGCGLMMITARLTAQVPEAKTILGLVSRGLFFLSGVMFSIDRFAGHSVVHQIMTANPCYIFLTAVRDSSIYRTAPSLVTWGELLAWSLGIFSLGFIFFWRAEDKYVRLV
ncbi:ABC-type polysaccharide/polyol phosphate export systems, permease component [Corynebacterium singulare]|uniref:Transport permease protein n=1 Tax=Corynebacterium singulare TaxID=161899 RepID=A0A0B6ESK9_9CORY|nr:ABC-type polysaccharide/polyol phosphate export systems, permease component [Corynebacterium singulare]